MKDELPPPGVPGVWEHAAYMQYLGTVDGRPIYWADANFVFPGLYAWDEERGKTILLWGDARPRHIQTEGEQRYEELAFFTALLLAVSEHRAKSLEVMEDFIADLKKASNG